jgi:hypothetical protein
VIEQIEKDERLQNLAEVGWTHQTCDGAVRPPAGALCNPTCRGLCGRSLSSRNGHLGSPRETSQDQGRILAAEAEAIGHGDIDGPVARGVGDVVEVAVLVRLVEVHR